MDQLAAAEDLQFFPIEKIIKEAVTIPIKSSASKFLLITLTFILPLSIAQLFMYDHHIILLDLFSYLFEHPYSSQTYKQLISALTYEFFYVIIFLFTFSLLSTAGVVFTVASLYASKPVSFIPTLFAIPRIFKRLFFTFLYVLLLNIIFTFTIFLLVVMMAALRNIIQSEIFFWFTVIVACAIYDLGQAYVWALWHMASVISVFEPDVFGLEAMKKSKQLLKGKTGMAFMFAALYLIVAWSILEVLCWLFYMNYVNPHRYKWIIRVLMVLCVMIMVASNLTGLLIQSVFYYVCKSYHHEVIDKRVLYDHLGGYLGEQCEPLRSTTSSTGIVEMMNCYNDHDMAGDVDVECKYVAPTSK